MSFQTQFFKVTSIEQKRNLCSLCRGYRRLCRKAICPILSKAKAFIQLEKAFSSEKIFGSSPPAVFVGSWNYPKVLAGPLVPPISFNDSSILDLPELWVEKSFNTILTYRFSLLRGKQLLNANAANNPNRILSTFQEIIMADKPIDTELWFNTKPKLSLIFSSREPPSGPSAFLQKTILAQNPHIPRPVDAVTSDTDMKAANAITSLYNSKINQRQITRLLSIGLLGIKHQRKLVPTEWSITAIDDILGKSLQKAIIHYKWINKCLVFGHRALANNVQILMFPSSWMFEAQEVWLVSQNPVPEVDYEFVKGRQKYATNLAGAYYATRLPVLEYLNRIRRQAGVLVFMEVYPEWIPLGVWRFREICRQALLKKPRIYDTLQEALNMLGTRLKLPLSRWLQQSRIFRWMKSQTRLTHFFSP